ncbi:hypothetical protein Tco_0386997 [Tanacetum coccineum]
MLVMWIVADNHTNLRETPSSYIKGRSIVAKRRNDTDEEVVVYRNVSSEERKAESSETFDILSVYDMDVYSLFMLERTESNYDEDCVMDGVMLKNFMNPVISKQQTLFYKDYHKYLQSGKRVEAPELSKFVMDVKIDKDLHGTNFDQLYAYLRQQEAHEIEVRIMKERFLTPLALALVANHPSVVYDPSYQAPAIHPSPQASFPLIDLELVVPLFLPSDDPIASHNKAMAFISTTFTTRYLPTNNQL